MKFFSSLLLLAVTASAVSILNGDIVARAPKGGGGGGGRGGGGSSGKGGSGESGSGSSRYALFAQALAVVRSSGDGAILRTFQRIRFSLWQKSAKQESKLRSQPSWSRKRRTKIATRMTSSSSGGRLGGSSSSTGGRTTTGSGVTPRTGGFYGGGAAVPYRSGQRSASGISPLLIGAGVGFGFGALWAHGAYNYPYTHPFIFHNATTNRNETKPVDCLCAADEECGCDDNSNTTYISSLIGDGSYAGLNQSLVTVADISGTSTIVINGTLPNGTTAAGGTVDANGASLTQPGGYMFLVALISAGIFLF